MARMRIDGRLFTAALSMFLAAGGCNAPNNDHAADTIPHQVRRRLAQAIWPENLFDSTGQPEPGFVRRGYKPEFSDLRIRHARAPEVLPDVMLFIGEAVSSGCPHCGVSRYAVAQRDSTFFTLLRAEDIAYLARWAKPGALADSVALREFVISSLRATCLVGCDVRQVHDRSEVPDADTPFLRPVGGDRTGWKIPRTYAWQRNGGVLVDFALLSHARGVYSVHAETGGPDGLRISVSPAAYYVFF